MLAGGRAVSFVRSGGPGLLPNLLVVSHGPDTQPYQDLPQNVYWNAGEMTLGAGQSFRRLGETTVYPAGLDLVAIGSRAAHSIAPGLVTGQGAVALGSVYDPGQAAYVVDATSGSIDLTLGAALARIDPAFVVKGFPYASWTIRLDGREIARSDRLSSDSGHAHQDLSAQRLAFVYLGSIAPNAPDTARTFEIRGQ